MQVLKKFTVLLTLIVLGAALAMPAFAVDRGTKDEAKALVEKAAAFYKANGKDKLIAEVNSTTGPLRDRDLYIIVVGMDGIRLAHGLTPKLSGLSLADAKDIDGKQYGQEIIDLGKGAGTGWVDYKFIDPVTSKIGEKTSYVLRVNDIIIFCGAYK